MKQWLGSCVLIALLAGAPGHTLPVEAQEQAPGEARVVVFKKWIGGSGDEADVQIHLFCRQGDEFRPLMVNQDTPGEWQVSGIPEQGIFCSVFEVERDTFMADDEDCRDLLVVPEQGAECTVVNTKLVKRIDMLNRYGLTLMIMVMLGAGLAAVWRREQA